MAGQVQAGQTSQGLSAPGREPNSRSGAVTTVTLAIQIAAQIEDLFVSSRRLAWIVEWCQAREWLIRRAGDRGVSRPRWSQSRSPVALPGRQSAGLAGSPGVVLQAGVDGVADAALEAAERFFAGLALGQLAVEVGAAFAVLVADLGDRGHVDGVIDAPVPAPRQPAGPAVPRRHLDGRGAVVSGEPVAAGEPGHLAGGADHGGGDDRADAEDFGQAGARFLDRRGE